ncbi:MAG: hypothetical protein H0U23_04045 [Blastocatellia bacterium]|nr:hypothetical protein [Blastocatellia bacterium]
MLKAITSAAPAAFPSVIACRSEPAPLSFVFTTVKVAAGAVAIEPIARKRRARLAFHFYGTFMTFLIAS